MKGMELISAQWGLVEGEENMEKAKTFLEGHSHAE